jgi:hypothetical protein
LRSRLLRDAPRVRSGVGSSGSGSSGGRRCRQQWQGCIGGGVRGAGSVVSGERWRQQRRRQWRRRWRRRRMRAAAWRVHRQLKWRSDVGRGCAACYHKPIWHCQRPRDKAPRSASAVDAINVSSAVSSWQSHILTFRYTTDDLVDVRLAVYAALATRVWPCCKSMLPAAPDVRHVQRSYNCRAEKSHNLLHA